MALPHNAVSGQFPTSHISSTERQNRDYFRIASSSRKLLAWSNEQMLCTWRCCWLLLWSAQFVAAAGPDRATVRWMQNVMIRWEQTCHRHLNLRPEPLP
jgi:hypothetical protein